LSLTTDFAYRCLLINFQDFLGCAPHRINAVTNPNPSPDPQCPHPNSRSNPILNPNPNSINQLTNQLTGLFVRQLKAGL